MTLNLISVRIKGRVGSVRVMDEVDAAQLPSPRLFKSFQNFQKKCIESFELANSLTGELII